MSDTDEAQQASEKQENFEVVTSDSLLHQEAESSETEADIKEAEAGKDTEDKTEESDKKDESIEDKSEAAQDADPKKTKQDDVPQNVKKAMARYKRQRNQSRDRNHELEQENARLKAQLEKKDTKERPDPADYDSLDEFDEALKAWEKEADKKPAVTDEPQEQAAKHDYTLADAQETVMDALDANLKGKVQGDGFTINRETVIAIADMDNPAGIIAKMVEDPELQEELADITSPYKLVKRLAAIEAEMSAEPASEKEEEGKPDTKEPEQRKSNASEPINPEKGSDTLKKDMNDLSFKEFEAIRNKQEQGGGSFW